MIKSNVSRLMQAALLCCLVVLFAACDDFFVNEDNPISSYLSINTRPVTIKVGDTYQRTATSTSTAVVEYSSNDTSVATVDNNGLVTGVSEGEASIIATATGYSKQTGKKIYVPVSLSYQVTVKPLGTSSGTTPTPSPAPAAPTPATVTTAPAAPSGDVNEFTATALVTAGVADGGTIMYKVTTTNAKPTTIDGFDATLPTAAALKEATYYVWYYVKADADHTDSDISASAVTTTVKEPAITLSTPMTMKALTAGTINVNDPQSGMKYSKNGGAKTAVSGAISVNIGDKVEFYGSAESYMGTNIKGGSADVRLYGNIMSLIDENGFATATAFHWSSHNNFDRLFNHNSHLIDAGGLLLPATSLTMYCYNGMFNSCINLATAPKSLPAMSLADNCYDSMFHGCVSLTTAPELPAATLADGCYEYMFAACKMLSSITCLATNISASNCTYQWLDGAGSSVTGEKTFYKAASMTSWGSGIDGTNGWTVKNK